MLLTTEDGRLILITLDSKSNELNVVKANLKSKSKLITACAYEDDSGLFTQETPEEVVEEEVSAVTEAVNAEIDDEDELLYGESAPSLFEKEKEKKNNR